MRLLLWTLAVALTYSGCLSIKSACPPRLPIPPLPEVVSVPAAQCPYALCFDAENRDKLFRKLAILKDAVQER